MFDLSLAEMALIVAVAVVAIGPKELPVVIRAVGRGIGQLRAMAHELKEAFTGLAEESGLKDAADEIEREARYIEGDDGQRYRSYDVPDFLTRDRPVKLSPPRATDGEP